MGRTGERCSQRRFLLLLALLAVNVTHISADKCRSGCQGVTPNTFKYQEGTTYTYNLESSIDIAVSSADGQQSTSKLKGTVLLTQQPNCVQVLRLQNVHIFGPDAKQQKYTGLANIDKPIRLNFHDGHVEDEICTEAGDTQNSLNIKRAVASMFQAALKADRESDVFGDCPTDITTSKNGGNLHIHKTRNLNRCNHRESIQQDFMANSFNLNSEIKSNPLVSSEYKSEQRVQNGILNSALVTENYLYLPFSNGKNQGAKATVTTKLTYSGTSADKVAAKCTEPRSIYFENPHQETTKTANVDNILNALKDTEKTMAVSVSENSAATFVQLVRVLRASKKNDILAVYNQVKSGAGGFSGKHGARKVFFDALFRAGTGEAVEAIVKLMKNKELNKNEQKLVYLSLAFIRHASKGSLTSAAALLDQPNIPREAYLGVGTLAGRYCREHKCANVEELNKLMQKLASKLNPQPADRKAENDAITVLKGLANVNHLTDEIADKIIQIANDKKAPTRLRVAALEAAQSDACKPKLITAALNLMKNRQEDSEIRIKAYLVAVECPDAKVATAVKELLDTEPVYQVGSYIDSHLRNLRHSVNPDRQHARHVMKDVKLADKKHFPIDPRKFSFNNELSYNFDTLGLGTNVDADVIYSQTSYLPRSANLNLTAEMFGQSFNFLEIGARQENLEKIVEHYFGPLGVLNSHEPEELIRDGKTTAEKLAEHVEQRLAKSRGKRDVSKAEIDTFAKQIKMLGSDLNKDLDLDLNIKLFGSELLFLSLNDDIHSLTPEAVIDKFFDELDTGIEKAKKFELHMQEHMMFLDTEVSYPTGMGFPLRINLEGAAAMHLSASGSVDIREILSNPQNAQLKLSLIPSTNIELAGYMTLDAHVIRSGLKVTSNMLTSTGTDVTLKVLNGKGLDLKVGLPVEKQTLIGFSHNVLFSAQELGKPEIMQPLKFKDKMKDFSMCFDQLEPMIGLEFCGELEYPSSLATNQVSFPLNGNTKLAVTVTRSDVTEYHFKALISDPSPDHRKLEITFETPGSKNDRHVSLLLEATTTPNKALKATITSPLKTAVAELVLTDNAQEKSLMGRFQYDTMEYYGKLGASVKGNDAKQIYKPLLEYSTPNDIVKTKGGRTPDYTVQGQVVVEKDGPKWKFTFDKVRLVAVGQPPIAIDGYLAQDGENAYSTDVKVNRDNMNVGVKAGIKFGPNFAKIQCELQNSINPNTNFKLDYDGKMDKHEHDHSLTLTHGPDLNSKQHCLTITHSDKYKYENKDDFEFGTKTKVSYPLLGVVGKLEAQTSNKHIKYDFELGYQKFKMESELDAKVNQKQFGDYDIKFDVEVLKNKVELVAKRDIVGDKSTVHNVLDISGRKYSVDGTITHQFKPNDINMATDLTIKFAEKPEPIKIDTGLSANQQSFDTHGKLTMGSNVVIDIVVKGERGANPGGDLKIIIADVINANGQLKTIAGKGDGFLLIELPKEKRKLKAETNFNFRKPHVNAALLVFFDFEKDNNNKLYLTTKNEISETSFDSKNEVELFSYTLLANAKGKLEGDFKNGKQDIEFDVTLPNGQILTGGLNRELKMVDDTGNGQAKLHIEHKDNKDSKPRRLELNVKAKDTNFNKGHIDLMYHLLAETAHGKNVEGDLHLLHKMEEVDDETHHDGQLNLKVHGNLLPEPLEVQLGGNFNHAGQYKALVKYGSDLGASLTGKYLGYGTQRKVFSETELEIYTPNKNLNKLKMNVGGSFSVPAEEGGMYETDGHVSVVLNDADTVKLEGRYKGMKTEGEASVSLTIPKEQPMSVAVGYKHEDTATGCRCHGHVDVAYGEGKQAKLAGTFEKVSDDEFKVEGKLNSAVEGVKDMHFDYHYKQSSSQRRFSDEANFIIEGKKYSLINQLDLSETRPLFETKYTHSDGKVSRIFAKAEKVSAHKYKGELAVENLIDFDLTADGEAMLESIDNFKITVHANSEKLKLHKIKAEAFNKPEKAAKRIQFSVTSEGKNLLSGMTSYKANREAGKLIVEGSGSVKVKDETRSATFKFIRTELEQAKDDEQGIEMLLNAGIGTQAIVAEAKLTNKQFRLLNSYCEEKKECAHVELSSKSSSPSVTEFSHELELNVDLRKLGLSHEFGLKAVTSRKDLVLDHTVDIHFESSASSKYQYSVYVHPHEAGVQFTTPVRVVSLEAHADYVLPKAGKLGPIKGEIALYMDKKNKPNKKSSLSYNYFVNDDGKVQKIESELRLTSPGLSKDFAALYHFNLDYASRHYTSDVVLDIFAKENQKLKAMIDSKFASVSNGYTVVSELSLVSEGLNTDIRAKEVIELTNEPLYDLNVNYHVDKTKENMKVLFKGNPKHIELLLSLCNKKLFHLNANMKLDKTSQVIDAQLSGIGIQDLVSHAELNNYNTFIYNVAKKAKPDHKLQVSAGFILGQIADTRAEIIRGDKKTSLAFASLQLDDANFLKPDFGINMDNIQKDLMESLKKENEHAVKDIQSTITDLQKIASNEVKSLSELGKKAAPNVKPVIQYYQQEFGKIKDELISDKTIQEVSELFKKVYTSTLRLLSSIFNALEGITSKLMETASETYTKLSETISKDLLPAVRELANRLLSTYLSILQDVYNVVMIYVIKITDILKEHQAELKQIATVISESMQDFGRLFVKFFNSIREDLQRLCNNLLDQIKALPVFDEFKQRYSEIVGMIPLPEQYLYMVSEMLSTLKEIMPTEELKHFISVVQDYIDKKIEKKDIDDAEALKQIYNSFLNAIASLLKQIQQFQAHPEDFKTLLENSLPIPLDSLMNLPRMMAIKSSLYNLLSSGDLPQATSFFHEFSLNPDDILPPFEMHAVIAQGQHIFTFDDRHLTFPGKCSYVLAKDAVNGNFTIAATYADGHLDSITFYDKHDVVTIGHNGKYTINGKNTELPLRNQHIHVFRLYETVQLVSKAGVFIACEPQLNLCGFHVSGFYHGQLRGLLGNGNYEPYDDFTQANGKITTSESDFGNSYKMNAACEPVATVDHAHHAGHAANPKCEKLFGKESPLALCHPFVSNVGYKQACDHGLQAGIADTEKYIAAAYVATCNRHFIPITMPKHLVQCTNGGGASVHLGDTFSVTVPTKSADIVIVVEQNKLNEAVFKELIQPAVTQINNELAARGISDVQYSLIGYGGDYKDYPSHYTSGGKLQFHDKSATLKFIDPEPKVESSGCEYVDWLIRTVEYYMNLVMKHTGFTPENDATREAFRYPFRADAAKAIVVVSGHAQNDLKPLMHLKRFVSEFSKSSGVRLSLVAPFEELKLIGKDAKPLKTIVGFNKHTVYTLGDAKKKGEGSTDMRKDLDYGLEYRIDYVTERFGGNVFPSNNFLQGKAGQRKQFIQVMSHAIVDQLTKSTLHMDCECKHIKRLQYQNVCHVTAVKEREQLQAAKKSGTKG